MIATAKVSYRSYLFYFYRPKINPTDKNIKNLNLKPEALDNLEDDSSSGNVCTLYKFLMRSRETPPHRKPDGAARPPGKRM